MISFEVSAKTFLTPEEIVNGMFNTSNWTSFEGSGLVPGIEDVEFPVPVDSIVGATFKVTNSDGSHHEETIIEYDPDQSLVMKLHKFSTPLNKFASHFLEIWTFSRQKNQTHLRRVFELYHKNFLGYILLTFISYSLKKGVENHTKKILHKY